ILRQRYSPLRTLRDVGKRLPQWLHHAPEFPDLVRDALRQAGRGEQRLLTDVDALSHQARLAGRVMRMLGGGLLGATLILSATLLWSLAPQHGLWPPLTLAGAGLLAFLLGWSRPR
ncbi:MAG: ubiquinone biosynthesis regulatory protein kinase UbiB, partial [Rhodanobacter sp.]